VVAATFGKALTYESAEPSVRDREVGGSSNNGAEGLLRIWRSRTAQIQHGDVSRNSADVAGNCEPTKPHRGHRRGLPEAKQFLTAEERIQAMSKATGAKFSIDRIATILVVCRSTVERLMNNGKLGYYQIGDRRTVGEGHLELYLSLTERKAKVKAIH
jgi:hypothetical protein